MQVEKPFNEGVFDRVVDIVIPQAKAPDKPGKFNISITWNPTFDSSPPPDIIGADFKVIEEIDKDCLVTLNDAGTGAVLDQTTVSFHIKIVTWKAGPIWFGGTCTTSVTLSAEGIGAAVLVIHTPGGMAVSGTEGRVSDNNVSAQARLDKQSAEGHATDLDAPIGGVPGSGDPNNFIAGLLPGTISRIIASPDFVDGKIFFGGAFG